MNFMLNDLNFKIKNETRLGRERESDCFQKLLKFKRFFEQVSFDYFNFK